MKTMITATFAILSCGCMLAQSTASVKDSVLAAAIDSMIDEYQLSSRKNTCIVIQLLSLDEAAVLSAEIYNAIEHNDSMKTARVYYSGFIRAQQGLWDIDRITDYTVFRGIPIVFETGLHLYFMPPNPGTLKTINKKLAPYLKPPFGVMAVWKLDVTSGGITLKKKDD
jgi:hypothetical protein